MEVQKTLKDGKEKDGKEVMEKHEIAKRQEGERKEGKKWKRKTAVVWRGRERKRTR